MVFLLTDIAGPRVETHSIAAEAQFAFRERAWELFSASGANESDAIATLAHDVNRSLMEAANGVRFAPTFLGCFNVTLGILTYCNAGRVLAVFRDAKSACVLEPAESPWDFSRTLLTNQQFWLSNRRTNCSWSRRA